MGEQGFRWVCRCEDSSCEGGFERVMHLRPWLRLPIAVPIAVVVLSSFCQAAEASVGVGVQGDPVRLRSVAHAGGSYAFPPVYVVNTGDQTESISVRAEQLSRGPDLAVPTSWVQARAYNSSRARQRGFPSSLWCRPGAEPGAYVGDVVAAESVGIAAGQLNFGAAAATKLEFPHRSRTSTSTSVAVAVAVLAAVDVVGHGPGLLLLAVAILGLYRAGLQIRAERTTSHGSAVDGRGGQRSAPGRNGW